MTHHPVRVARNNTAARIRRGTLLRSCAAAAIAVAAAMPQQASAQAFQGTPFAPPPAPALVPPNVATQGTATRTITSSTTEEIMVGTSTATINWLPFDNDGSGPIDFLPEGHVATFTNDPNAISNFTVLNRILPSQTSRPVQLNGTVISQIQDLSENVTQGGAVWFYAPGGLVVGATAVFNVGSLLLTANDVTSFSTSATGFGATLAAATDSTSNITIESGAKISATPENSYVAVVAPRVVQNGEVSVNGSAAYVGAEAVTLTMSQGLFDIQVTAGTADPFNPDSGNGVVHQGTTGGPASSGAGDNHRIYMVAVPKNQALTMLLAGNAGFTPASSASLNNGQIVLAAGSSIAETSGTLLVTSPAGINADLEIGPGTYTSDVRGFARGDIDVIADGSTISFARDLSLTSLLAAETGVISLSASAGGTLSVGRNVTLQTSGATFSSGAPEELNITVDGGTVSIGNNLSMFAGAASDGTQGDVEIEVRDDIDNQGSLTVGGQTLISTTAPAASINPDTNSANAIAGDITIETLNGGSISLGNTLLFATANGQDNSGNGSGFLIGRAGYGDAGDITIASNNGGSITVNGNLSAFADGIGGRMLDGGLVGGDGYGGSIDVETSDGTILITGNTFLSALGNGGSFIGSGTPASAQGGSGYGGQATIFVGGSGFNPDPSSITINGNTTIRADGTGGSAQAGGYGQGGTAGISGNKGTITMAPTGVINLSARGTGGHANKGFGGSGGDGVGGDVYIEALAVPPGVEQFASAASISGGNATFDGTGTGGTGGAGNGDNIPAGSGGDGYGSAPCSECFFGGVRAIAQVDGGSLTLGNVTLFANGDGGAGGAGGNDQAGGGGGEGHGGVIRLGLFDYPFDQVTGTTGTADYGTVLAFASGNGGNGGAGGAITSPGGGQMPQGDGGASWGGSIYLWSNNSVSASSLTFFANANGGTGGNGGAAQGGFSTIEAVDGLIDISGDVVIEAAAATGDGTSGNTGDATAGTATVLADSAVITIGGSLFVGSNGDAEDGVTGGTGTGGTASVVAQNGGSISAASMDIQAVGEGGNGLAQAGSGFGGTAELRADGGTITVTGVAELEADGRGGSGGLAGDGIGNTAVVQASNGGTINAGTIDVQADGAGGSSNSGAGGTGRGGFAILRAEAGSTITAVNLAADTSGDGGAGLTGGDGFGGQSEISALGGDALLTATGLVTVEASGQGGLGSSGSGGTGTGGLARLFTGIEPRGSGPGGTATIANALVQATGTGGDGATGGDGDGGRPGVESFGGVEIGSRLGILTVTGTLNADADGTGGNATAGAGGYGQGGTVMVSANLVDDVGTATVTLGAADLSAVGAGGAGGGSGAAGGDGDGGEVTVVTPTAGSRINATSLTLHAGGAGGTGGSGAVGGDGGTGTAGHALIDISAGSAGLGIVQSYARGFGGAGGDGSSGVGGDGGSGNGGLSELIVSSTLTATSYSGLALGFGGDGGLGTTAGAGGFGGGSSAVIDILTGGTATFTGAVALSAMGVGGAGSDGGSGSGSSATINIAEGGSLSAADLFVDANAFGGDGSNGSGGDANGGFATVDNAGTLTVTDESFVSADSSGGDGTSAGGDGFGGNARAWASGTGVTTLGPLTEISADGFGGAASAGTGGDGDGGYGLLQVYGGGQMTGGDATVTAFGSGGDGTSGGAGIGGRFGGEDSGGAFIEAFGAGSTMTFTGTASTQAIGFGGDASSGTRGDAAGGLARVSAYDGGAISAAGASIVTSAVDGAGASPATGTGGTATLEAVGGTLTIGGATLFSNGTAQGGNVEISSSSYFGSGSGEITLDSLTATANGPTAGDIFVFVENGSFADLGVAQLTATGLSGGSITIDLGADPFFGEFAGIGTLGLDNILLTADSLTLTTSGDIDINSQNGASIDVAGTFLANAAGAMALDDIDDTAVVRADVIDFSAASFSSTFDILGRVIDISTILDLDVTGTVLIADETLTLSSNADVIAGDLDAGLEINLFAGGDITTGDLTSGGTIVADAFGGLDLGNLTSAGETNLDANGDIFFGNADVGSIDFSTDGSVTGGNIVADTEANGDSEGAILLGDITVGPGPEPADDFSVGFASATSITVGDVQSIGRVGFATLGDLSTGDIDGGSLVLALVSGDIDTGAITTAADGRVYLADSSMFIDAGGVEDFDPVPVLAAAPVATSGSISVGPVSTGRFQAAAGTDFDAASITAGTSIEASAGNDISTGNLTAGTTIEATAGNDISTGNLTAGTTVVLDAGHNLSVDDVTAGDSATFTAGGTAGFFGTVSAPEITVTSWDIEILGQLGEHGVTDLVTLNAVGDGPDILIGGEDLGELSTQSHQPQYWLSNDEEIQADSIVFNVVNAGEGPTPNVVVSDFLIEGSLTDGGGVSYVELNTDGSVFVEGTLAYVAASATDEFVLNVGDLQVNTSTGGRIAMVDASEEAPGGLLEINADHIWVGDQALLDSLRTDVNFAGRDGMVGTNSGDFVPEGYLIADGMTLNIGQTLFVQNSGTPDEFAGITVGAGGLTIRTTGEAPAGVVAYGRMFNADGTFTVNNAFFELVDFGLDQGSTYTDLSEFNECLINSGCAIIGNPDVVGPEQILGPVDLMNDPEETIADANGEDGDGGGDSFADQLIDTGNLTDDELIDEGVTSGGDNSKWVGDECEPDSKDPRCVEDGADKEPTQ